MSEIRDKATEIYAELENGELIWMTSDWLKHWEEDEIETCKERKDD